MTPFRNCVYLVGYILYLVLVYMADDKDHDYEHMVIVSTGRTFYKKAILAPMLARNCSSV